MSCPRFAFAVVIALIFSVGTTLADKPRWRSEPAQVAILTKAEQAFQAKCFGIDKKGDPTKAGRAIERMGGKIVCTSPKAGSTKREIVDELPTAGLAEACSSLGGKWTDVETNPHCLKQ